MKTILVDVMPEETRLAIVEDGALEELFVERSSHAPRVGNIYKGRVQNVFPGMEAAFVDIGGRRNAFLYLGGGRRPEAARKGAVSGRVHVGQSLLVQVTKEAAGGKGPRVTDRIALPGRNAVLLPTAAYVNLSRRIEGEAERRRLRALAERVTPSGMGLIVRTAAAGRTAAAIEADVRYLARLWSSIEARYRLAAAPSLLYRDAELAVRLVRDHLTEDVDDLLVDDAAVCRRILELLPEEGGDFSRKIRLYDGPTPLFREYQVEDVIARLEDRVVPLPSGGFLVIDRTEALTVIDVNTGKFVGDVNLSDTVYRLNLEAAGEILRQLRLRNIGGIIIVDFIDMETAEQRETLLARLREAARRDRSQTDIVGLTALGLVEMTRKKTRQDLASLVGCQCPICEGRGQVASSETVGIRILRHIRRAEARSHAPFGYEVEVAEEVAAALRETGALDGLRREIGTPILVSSALRMRPDGYAISRRSGEGGSA